MKRKITNNKLIIISNIILLGIFLFFKSDFLLIIISLCGVNYTYLIAKKQRIGYLFGIVNLSLYGIYLLFSKTYALGIYNLLYALPLSIFGYFYWNKNKEKYNELDNKFKITIFFLILFTIYIFNFVLNKAGGNIPFFDSLSTVLCSLGSLLMSLKYKEQWPVWLLANFVNIIIYLMLTYQNINTLPLLIMWIVHFLNSIYGYYNWYQEKK